MEFLKKHYEKIAVAIVSLMMIATAVILGSRLSFAGSVHPEVDRAKAKPLGTNELAQIRVVLQPDVPLGTNDLVWISALLDNPHVDKDVSAHQLDTNEMMQIATLLKNPPAWQTNDGQRPFIPEEWVWNGKEIFRPAPEQTGPIIPNDPADELAWLIAQRKFPMRFMAVASEGVFQINIAGGNSRFVKVGDVFKQIIFGTEETFTVLRFESKTVKQFDRSLGQEREVDISVLTLQRKSVDVIKQIPLMVGKTISESEPVGRCVSRVTNQMFDNLKPGSKIAYKDKQYEVVSLDTGRALVIFKDIQTKQTYTREARVVLRF